MPWPAARPRRPRGDARAAPWRPRCVFPLMLFRQQQALANAFLCCVLPTAHGSNAELWAGCTPANAATHGGGPQIRHGHEAPPLLDARLGGPRRADRGLAWGRGAPRPACAGTGATTGRGPRGVRVRPLHRAAAAPRDDIAGPRLHDRPRAGGDELALPPLAGPGPRGAPARDCSEQRGRRRRRALAAAVDEPRTRDTGAPPAPRHPGRA
mmetsp:Transcript_7581/g.19958  ORF Transcript_7581/g.19958 Transcript_7581/m.19958 type:complete len:210 (+) Transcript_7581:1048-1677(+)